MSTKIRLARGGSKKRPYYRIVVADSRSSRDGRFIEKIGSYNPMLAKDNAERVVLQKERIIHWLTQGAVPTQRIVLFLNDAKIGQDFKVVKVANDKRAKVIKLKSAEIAEKKAQEAAKKKAEDEAEAAEEAAKKKAEDEAKAAEEAAAKEVAAKVAEDAKAAKEAEAAKAPESEETPAEEAKAE